MTWGRKWGLGVDRVVWNYYARTAYVTAFQLVTLLLTNINSELKLGFNKDLDHLVPIMNAITERDIRARIKEIIQRETQAATTS